MYQHVEYNVDLHVCVSYQENQGEVTVHSLASQFVCVLGLPNHGNLVWGHQGNKMSCDLQIMNRLIEGLIPKGASKHLSYHLLIFWSVVLNTGIPDSASIKWQGLLARTMK
jgi:hypothetical protein